VPGYTQISNAKILSAYFFNKDCGLVASTNFNTSTQGIYKTYNGGNT